MSLKRVVASLIAFLAGCSSGDRTPSVGQVYTFDIGDGRYGACVVIRQPSNPDERSMWGNVWLVQCSHWIGDQKPGRPNPEMLEPLIQTHHSYNSKPWIRWIGEKPPEQFIPIGKLRLHKSMRELESRSLTNWESLASSPLSQWNWDHNREAVLESDRRRAAELEEARERRATLESATLEALQSHQFVERWVEYPSPEAIRGTRAILEELRRELGTEGCDQFEAFKRAVLALNALDAKLKYFIETMEREALCSELELIAYACGAPELFEQAVERHREW